MEDLLDNALFVELMGVSFDEAAIAEVMGDESRHEEFLEMLDIFESSEDVQAMAAPIREMLKCSSAEIRSGLGARP